MRSLVGTPINHDRLVYEYSEDDSNSNKSEEEQFDDYGESDDDNANQDSILNSASEDN